MQAPEYAPENCKESAVKPARKGKKSEFPFAEAEPDRGSPKCLFFLR